MNHFKMQNDLCIICIKLFETTTPLAQVRLYNIINICLSLGYMYDLRPP